MNSVRPMKVLYLRITALKIPALPAIGALLVSTMLLLGGEGNSLLFCASAQADEVLFQTKGNDAILRSLEKLTGKKVTLRLNSGEEISGTIRSVGDSVVHLGELQQREFFDALIRIDSIAGIIARAK